MSEEYARQMILDGGSRRGLHYRDLCLAMDADRLFAHVEEIREDGPGYPDEFHWVYFANLSPLFTGSVEHWQAWWTGQCEHAAEWGRPGPDNRLIQHDYMLSERYPDPIIIALRKPGGGEDAIGLWRNVEELAAAVLGGRTIAAIVGVEYGMRIGDLPPGLAAMPEFVSQFLNLAV